MPEHLDSHQRDTVGKLFEHPPSRNVEWRQVESLLEAVGTVERRSNGKLVVRVGTETEVLTPPHGKDVDPQMLVDVRRMLQNAGYGPDGIATIDVEELGRPATDENAGRWGEP